MPLKTHKKPIQDYGLATRLHLDLWQDCILVPGAPRRFLHQAGSPARTRRQHQHWFLSQLSILNRHNVELHCIGRLDDLLHSDGGEKPGSGQWETQHLFWWIPLASNWFAVLTFANNCFHGTILTKIACQVENLFWLVAVTRAMLKFLDLLASHSWHPPRHKRTNTQLSVKPTDHWFCCLLSGID